MRNITLVQIIKALKSSNKSDFKITLKGQTNNYIISINNIITCEVLDKLDNTIYQFVRNYAEDIDIDDVSVTSIKESRYNCGDLVEEHTLYLKREVELYIKLFKVLKENVMFFVESNEEVHQLHYINGRVYRISETESEYEVSETDLLRLGLHYPDFNIILFSQLPKRYHYSNFFAEQNSIAVAKGKKFRNYKRGVQIR